MARIALYGYDKSPGTIVTLLEQEARNRGHDTRLYAPQKIVPPGEYASFDMLVMGLSSNQPHEVHLAQQLLTFNGKLKIVLVEDTVAGRFRENARPLAPRVDLVLTAVDGIPDLPDTPFGYKNLVHAGPPPHWRTIIENMRSAPELDRRVLRKQVPGVPASQPLNHRDHWAYIPGIKNQEERMNQIIASAGEAARQLKSPGGDIALLFRPHPGKTERSAAQQQIVDRQLEERRTVLKTCVTLENVPTSWQDEHLDALADAVLYTGGGPTTSIARSYLRLPNSAYIHDPSLKSKLGTDWWPPAAWGCSERIERITVQGIRTALERLLSHRGDSKRKRAQRKHFPLPPSFDTTKAYVDAIERIL